MDSSKVVSFIESSFLHDLLTNENVTDISYNGRYVYYLDNLKGRQKSDISLEINTAKDFIRQIANLCEKQFSFQDPSLDVSAGKYRINAIHQSIARVNNEPAICFSIRIASYKPRISKSSSFLTPELVELFEVLIKSKISFVIGGLTGTGKTEFQKFLISLIPSNTRIIIIDNVLELDGIQNLDALDVNFWQVNDYQQNSSTQVLVKNALRSNPDWLIVAEARGGEMLDVLNSSLTGHPIMTTIHAFDMESMPTRMARMVMMNSQKMNYEDIIKDIYYHLRIYVYLKREIDEEGAVHRFISSIGCATNNSLISIYKYIEGKHLYFPIPDEFISLLYKKAFSPLFKSTFIKE